MVHLLVSHYGSSRLTIRLTTSAQFLCGPRHRIQDAGTANLEAKVAGFGPRFLHSTGQAYKGGPNSGTFLTITRDPNPDIAVPGHKANFETVQIAQACGDTDVLATRGRHVLRVHLKKNGGGIAALKDAVLAAL